MRASNFGGGSYLKAKDVKVPQRAVISAVVAEEFKGNDGIERKLVLQLDMDGGKSKLSLNKSNLNTLIAALGDETDNWIGRTIAVYFDPSVQYGGQAVGGIRVKIPGHKTAAEKARDAQVEAERLLNEELGNLAPKPTVAPGVVEADEDPIPF